MTVSCNNDITLLTKLVSLYSFQRVLIGDSNKILRPRLIDLIVMYLKYGYNRESKNKILEITGISEQQLNSFNMELREKKYLFKDFGNEKLGHLHENIVKLGEYAKNMESVNDYEVAFKLSVK